MLRNILLLTLIAGVGCSKAKAGVAEAQKHAEHDKIRLAIEAEISKYKLIGVAVTAFKDGNIIYSEGFGLSSKSPEKLMTPNTPVMLASTTKPLTGAAILKLQEQGKLSIEDPLGKFVPEVPDSWRQLKIRHLLSHTSGITDYTKFPDFMQLYGKDLAREEVFKHVFASPLQFKAGEKMEYSNTAYHLLGVVVERASKVSFDEYLQANICIPAGMKSTRLVKPKPNTGHLATGYDTKGDPAAYASPAWSFTAGAIASSSEDMARFMIAIEAGKLLSGASIKAMTTPTKLTTAEEGRLANANNMRYGLGWLITALNGSLVFAHAGGRPGSSTIILYLPKQKYGIAVLVNQTDGHAMEVAQAVTKVVVPEVVPAGE